MSEKKEEKRKQTRVGISLQVRVGSESEDEFVENFATNVSKGGIFIQCREPKPKGTVVSFEIRLKGGKAVIRGKGKVAWTRTRDPKAPKPQVPGMGLKFMALDKPSKAIIKRILAIKTPPSPKEPASEESRPAATVDRPSPVAPPAPERPAPTEIPVPPPPEATAEGGLPPLPPLPGEQPQPAEETAPPSDEISFDIDIDADEDDFEVDISVDDFVEPSAEAVSEAETEAESEATAQDTAPEEPPAGPAGEHCLGIDLGTTNSCAAVVIKGKPEIILTRKGYRTMPSVVTISEDGRTLVGHPAWGQLELNPEHTVYGAKRLIGRHFSSPAVQQMKDRFHYQIVPNEDLEPAVCIRGQILSLQQISALILREYRELAEEKLGQPVNRAIISVPAYYSENQRQAVREAGKLAGLSVERIVNEPTAASLAYGYRKGYQKRLLVYDLGGGTFDVSLLDLCDEVYEVVATGGDPFLGGVDFDNQLVDHVLNELITKVGTVPRIDRTAFQRLRGEVERVKCELSEQEESVIQLSHFVKVGDQMVSLEIPVNRGALEMLTAPLVERTMTEVNDVMLQAGLLKSQVDEILLVGGQTRMPLIWRRLESEFSRTPHKGVHPDEAVAVGAALLGNALGKIDNILLIDVLAVSIGYGTSGGRFRPILNSGASLPASVTFMVRTNTDQQESLQLQVFQGDNDRILNNEYLGTAEVSGITPAPRGTVQLKITFALDVQGLLSITVLEHPGGKENPVSFEMQYNEKSLRKVLQIPEDEMPSELLGIPLSLRNTL